MAETMILVPGRSQSQGTSLNEKVTSTAELNEKDMRRLKLKDGDKIKLKSDVGQTVVTCMSKKEADLPTGMIFIPYGPPSSELMASDTAGTGMPLSKHMEVKVTKVK